LDHYGAVFIGPGWVFVENTESGDKIIVFITMDQLMFSGISDEFFIIVANNGILFGDGGYFGKDDG